MSDPNPSAPSAEEVYYASGSYQQGSNSVAVAQAPTSSISNDKAYAQILQDQEYRNAQQQQQVL